MLNFRSVFKCMALCLRCSSASGTSYPPQRGTVLTANLTWNCSLNERLSLLQMKSEAEFLLTCTVAPRQLMVQGAGLKSCLCCLSANVTGRLSFIWLQVLVTIQMKSHSRICYVERRRTRKAVRVTELPTSSTESTRFLLHHERGHVLLLSSSLTPVESHKSHLHKESQPFWLPSPSKPTRYWWGYFTVFGCI